MAESWGGGKLEFVVPVSSVALLVSAARSAKSRVVMDGQRPCIHDLHPCSSHVRN